MQVAWTTFHNNKNLVQKYMASYHIGNLVEEQKEVCSLRTRSGVGNQTPRLCTPIEYQCTSCHRSRGGGSTHKGNCPQPGLLYTNIMYIGNKFLLYLGSGILIQTCRLFWQHLKITQDFLKLREEMEEMVCSQLFNITYHKTNYSSVIHHVQGMFKVNPIFVMAMFAHAIFFEAAAWFLLWYIGNTWTTWIISAMLFATGQIQQGWLEHDLVHGSIFNSRKVNRFFNDISLGLLQVCARNECLTGMISECLPSLIQGSANKLVGRQTLSTSCKTKCGGFLYIVN